MKVMKKLLIGAVMAAMLISPTIVKAGNNDWVGPAIVGTVFGIIIGSANNHHGHSAPIIVQNPNHHHPHGQWTHSHRHLYEWVKVCRQWPQLRQDYWGDYYQVFRYECRMVKKARW